MKKPYFLHVKSIFLATLISLQGCTSRIAPIITNTVQPTNVTSTAPVKTAFMPLTNTATPIPVRPGWQINSSALNYAIIVLDYQTLTLKSAYIQPLSPCQHQVDDEVIKSRADGFFEAVMEYGTRRVTADGKTELGINVQRVGDFALAEISPNDFGGAAILDPCNGLVLFAGSIVYDGAGEQLYPATPIRPDALRYQTGQIPQPQRIDGRAGPSSTGTEGYEKAWNSVQSLNLVQDFASSSYSVFVYLYPRTVGVFLPENADWVIFLHRDPSQ